VSNNNFINKDLRNRSQAENKQYRSAFGWIAAGFTFIILGLLFSLIDFSDNQNIPLNKNKTPIIINKIDTNDTNSIQLKLPTKQLEQKQTLSTPIAPPPTPKASKIDPAIKEIEKAPPSYATFDESRWQSLKVNKGDSLSIIFERAKIKPAQLHQLMRIRTAAKTLKRIHPNDIIKVIRGDKGELIALNYQIDNIRYLKVERQDKKLKAKIYKHKIDIHNAYASAVIASSLFLASANAGLSHNTTMELANVFGWDIDFALDIRKGDKFTVIYEQRFKDGQKIKDGNILAAEFINQGKIHRAVRYTDPTSNRTGYYSPKGNSLRKAFLRSPVKFNRISSRFTTKRYHPILHRFRSHKGVDYAAGRGTPIRASGDGKIIHKGRKGGYGRTIIIKHGSRYTTLYAHMNSYNKKSRKGRNVKQGQIIGYVGSSGLASGPHLHYEFRVNGVHRNPLTVKFPSTEPIPKRYRENFKSTTQQYLSQLDVLSRNPLALNKRHQE